MPVHVRPALCVAKRSRPEIHPFWASANLTRHWSAGEMPGNGWAVTQVHLLPPSMVLASRTHCAPPQVERPMIKPTSGETNVTDSGRNGGTTALSEQPAASRHAVAAATQRSATTRVERGRPSDRYVGVCLEMVVGRLCPAADRACRSLMRTVLDIYRLSKSSLAFHLTRSFDPPTNDGDSKTQDHSITIRLGF